MSNLEKIPSWKNLSFFFAFAEFSRFDMLVKWKIPWPIGNLGDRFETKVYQRTIYVRCSERNKVTIISSWPWALSRNNSYERAKIPAKFRRKGIKRVFLNFIGCQWQRLESPLVLLRPILPSVLLLHECKKKNRSTASRKNVNWTWKWEEKVFVIDKSETDKVFIREIEGKKKLFDLKSYVNVLCSWVEKQLLFF